jgi:hypothetical protein
MTPIQSMTMPYIVGPPIRHPNDFYGRSAELARFFELIGGTQTQSIKVRGLRRAGKTSFLQYATHPEVIGRYLPHPDSYVIIYVDISASRRPSEFYYRVLQRLSQTLPDSQSTGWQSPRPDETKLYDVETVLCQFPQKRFILLIDEFDHINIDNFGQEFLVELRALTVAREYDLACVTASYWDPYHLAQQIGLPPTSPFYNVFYPTPLFLPGLEAETADSLIQQPARQAQVRFEPNQIEQILQLGGTLPFFVQATAAQWYRLVRLGQTPDVDVLQQQLMTEMAPYFGQWWRHFQPDEREVLLLLAQQQLHGGVAETAVLPDIFYSLHKFGLVVQERGRLFINGDLFATWIVQESSKYVDPKTADSVPTYNPASLRRVLIQYFDREELRILCHDLHVDFDELRGETKSAKASELVHYWKKRNGLDRLVEAIRYERGAII